jgi:hypothetical protein
LDVPRPPEATLDEDGRFNPNPNDWDAEFNSDARSMRDVEWDVVQNEIWPGSSTDKRVEQVSEDYFNAFEYASSLNTNSKEDFGSNGSYGGGGNG